jgi:hypothetical protein
MAIYFYGKKVYYFYIDKFYNHKIFNYKYFTKKKKIICKNIVGTTMISMYKFEPFIDILFSK